jgi:hypothetical protein
MLTYDDLIAHLLAYGAQDATQAASAQHRRAVQAAYNLLPTLHPWNYYWTLGRVTTSAPYSTGTVAFDLTGGANERQLTLTDGVWPTWAALGYVRIDSTTYQVATRVSDTIVTLAETSSPAADIASGTSFEIMRDTYPLPSDFVAGDEPTVGTDGHPLEYRHARTWATDGRFRTTSRPRWFSYVGSPTARGRLQLVVSPPPDDAYPIDFVYRRSARLLVFDGPQVGLASVAAAGTTVTGSQTAFRSAMIGSVIRFGTDSKTRPTGLGGLNPRAHEAYITDVASATSLTIDEGPTDAVTSAAFTISDPCDVDEVATVEFLLRECERQWRAISRSSGGPMTTSKAEQEEYKLALTRARENDSRYSGRRASMRSRGGYRPDPSYPEGVAGEDYP